MRVGFPEPPLGRAVFTRSIRELGWQPGAPKPREHDFPIKRPIPLKLIGPVTPLWVLYPSETMQMGFMEHLLARAGFTRSIRVLGWQPGPQNPGSTIFRKKTSYFFEIHRTSDTSMGSAVLLNHAYGLYRISTSQGSVYKVN